MNDRDITVRINHLALPQPRSKRALAEAVTRALADPNQTPRDPVVAALVRHLRRVMKDAR
jgi:phenylpyruvate tautomerase PptA (4-oxalocrotonate tautomerase family)